MLQPRFLAALLLAIGSVLFSSCGNSDHVIENDSMPLADSTPPDLDSVLKADSTVTASYHLSKEDSTEIADSLARTKNRIRDFN